ncbi:E2-like enzyme [Malassezia psittaci]|uniref:Autophagy-related protein 3 n=1 Tax=Malassezia psittaci TaxID=1821823 RepID=A0AAF0FCR1_9BASI|nr:E2-like enzyme [Malassezia psittaci]
MHAVHENADDQSRFLAVRDSLTPVLRESKFKEHGRITPEEFVLAGDFLVYKHPSWQWCAGEAWKAREYLPEKKQFLINKGVPCFRRVSTLPSKKRRSRLFQSSSSTGLARLNHEARKYGGRSDDSEQVLHLDEDADEHESWIVMNSSPDHSGVSSPVSRRTSVLEDSWRALPARLDQLSEDRDVQGRSRSASRISSQPSSRQSSRHRNPDSSRRSSRMGFGDDDASEELHGFSEGLEEQEDPATFLPGVNDLDSNTAHDSRSASTMAVRTYDCMITYDKYYQTPRMWLIGYDEEGLPLQPTQIFEDVASDYALKTVTIEPFPHGSSGSTAKSHGASMHVASIHPCKHASMMRKMIHRMNESGQYREQGQPLQPIPSRPQLEKRSHWWPSAKSGRSQSPHVSNETESEPDTEVRVDQYLMIFLKFMASIVPTIEIDADHTA